MTENRKAMRQIGKGFSQFRMGLDKQLKDYNIELVRNTDTFQQAFQNSLLMDAGHMAKKIDIE